MGLQYDKLRTSGWKEPATGRGRSSFILKMIEKVELKKIEEWLDYLERHIPKKIKSVEEAAFNFSKLESAFAAVRKGLGINGERGN